MGQRPMVAGHRARSRRCAHGAKAAPARCLPVLSNAHAATVRQRLRKVCRDASGQRLRCRLSRLKNRYSAKRASTITGYRCNILLTPCQ